MKIRASCRKSGGPSANSTAVQQTPPEGCMCCNAVRARRTRRGRARSKNLSPPLLPPGCSWPLGRSAPLSPSYLHMHVNNSTHNHYCLWFVFFFICREPRRHSLSVKKTHDTCASSLPNPLPSAHATPPILFNSCPRIKASKPSQTSTSDCTTYKSRCATYSPFCATTPTPQSHVGRVSNTREGSRGLRCRSGLAAKTRGTDGTDRTACEKRWVRSISVHFNSFRR